MSHGGRRARTASTPARTSEKVAASWAHGKPSAPWLVAGIVALAALFWASRGAPLGTPVADDYAFLARLRFQHPLDPFDSMGASYYWRPLSRQAYFSLIGPSLVAAPWIAVVVHALLFAALFAILFRIARRLAPAPAAAAIAVFPLVSESARVLLGWPSGAQHLLAMVFAALAVHEVLAGRAWTAGLSALAGMLSHDSAVVVLPFLPAVGWMRTRSRTEAVKALAAAVVAGGLWGIGYAIARAHGVQLPHGGVTAAVPRIPELLSRSLTAQLNLEDLGELARAPLAGCETLLFLAAGALLFSSRMRARVRANGAALAGGLAWFVLASLPLALLLPDWNAWRGSVAGLGFGLVATGFLALASTELALLFAGIRLVALLFAAQPDPLVGRDEPPSTTDISFVRLARLQRIVGDTHRALLGRHPTLPKGADVRYWWAPTMAEVGFQGPLALRTWYADSTLTWRGYGGKPGAPGVEAVVEYDLFRQWRVVAIEPEAVRLIGEAQFALEAGRLDQGDSLVFAGRRVQKENAPEYLGAGELMMVSSALTRKDLAAADSLNENYLRLVGPRSRYYGMRAAIAALEGRPDDAERDVTECLRLDPKDEVGTNVLHALERVKASRPK